MTLTAHTTLHNFLKVVLKSNIMVPPQQTDKHRDIKTSHKQFIAHVLTNRMLMGQIQPSKVRRSLILVFLLYQNDYHFSTIMSGSTHHAPQKIFFFSHLSSSLSDFLEILGYLLSQSSHTIHKKLEIILFCVVRLWGLQAQVG